MRPFYIGLIIAALLGVTAVTFTLDQTQSLHLESGSALEVTCSAPNLNIEIASRNSLKLICPSDSSDPTPQPVVQDAYYVAASGDDSAAGSVDAPYRTIQHGVDQLKAGDVLYVREGVYTEEVIIDNSGESGNPITISAYPGERPIIDGRYVLPPPPSKGWDVCNDTVTPSICMHYQPIVSIEGNHIVFEGFDVTQSNGRGIRVWRKDGRPQNIVIRNNHVYDNRNAGIISLSADDVLIENNRVWHNVNFATHDRNTNVLNWPHAVTANYSTNITYRGNVVFENWGEGIGTGTGSVNITIEDNVIYDNKVQIYIHRSQEVTVQRNLVYCTNRPEYRRGGDPPPGIAMNNEADFAGDLEVENAEIINNIVVGCSQNFAIWSAGDEHGIGVRNVLVAHNTLVNAVSNPWNANKAIGMNILDGPHVGVEIKNNLIVQSTGTIAFSDTGSVKFSNNLWSRTPPKSVQGSGDIIADPKLVNADATLIPGAVDPEWYRLQSTSQAVNNAQVLSHVTNDFFNNVRDGQPDIGAHELPN